MARGHQKFQSQQKNAQKMEKLKKAQGHDQKSAAQKALVFTCFVCKVRTCTWIIMVHAVLSFWLPSTAKVQSVKVSNSDQLAASHQCHEN